MRSVLILLMIPVFLSLAGSRPAASPVAVVNGPVSINDVTERGAQAPPLRPVADMTWIGSDGKVQKLKDFRGKVVILDFWATYSPPCIEAIPHFMRLQEKYGRDKLEVVGLHAGGHEDLAKVPEFVRRLNITYPIANPEEALTSYIFGRESAILQTAVFDREGRLVKKIIGFNKEIQKELDAAVEETIDQGE